MSISSLFVTAFLVGLSGALMPGPLLTLTIGESLKRGFRAGPLIVLGHALLELALVITLAAGLASVLSRETVSAFIGVVGGVFLAYLGVGMIKEGWAGRISLAASTGQYKSPQGINPVLGGAMVSLSNPYWSLWWATVGLSYIGMAIKKGSMGIAAFYSGHIMADVVWYLAIAAMVTGGRRFINDSIYRAIIAICGVFLVVMGAFFVKYGLTTWLS